MKTPVCANLLSVLLLQGIICCGQKKAFLFSRAVNCTVRVKIWSRAHHFLGFSRVDWNLKLILLAAQFNLTCFEASGADRDTGPALHSVQQFLCFRAQMKLTRFGWESAVNDHLVVRMLLNSKTENALN